MGPGPDGRRVRRREDRPRAAVTAAVRGDGLLRALGRAVARFAAAMFCAIVRIGRASLSDEHVRTLKEFEERLVLIYTGKTRLSRNLVQVQYLLVDRCLFSMFSNRFIKVYFFLYTYLHTCTRTCADVVPSI